MAITVTESAARQINSQIAKRGSGLALRIGVKPSGCSGYSYTYSFADEIGENDMLFEENNAKVVMDKVSLMYMDGSKLDFVTEGLKHTFKIDNPKVTAMCGCGESFSIKS
jgi:iron-sulfur cluster assembly protein